MAEEQLNLIDNMSPSLKRIYQEAEKLNKRMLTLRSSIKALEKPASLSYMRRELKEVEKQAQQTERAIKAMKSAELSNAKYGAFKVGANGSYYVNGMMVSKANQIAMAEAYNRNVQNAQLRRNRMLWNTGRMVNGLTFEERLQRRMTPNQFRRAPYTFLNNKLQEIGGKFGLLDGASRSLTSSFLSTTLTMAVFAGIVNSVGRILSDTFIRPQSEFISNYTRVALTSDSQKTPREMMDSLYETASRTRAPADATMMLYNRIALSGVKASNERIRRFVESFNKVTAISGTTAQENRAVMLQLAQGIGSNRLGGDEFRSISEQAPLFKYMLAKGMNVNPGSLKQMGADGKLTAEAILSAMEKVQDQIDLIFKEAPLTIDQTVTILQNKWSQLLNEQFTGYLAIRDLLKDIINWMETPRGKDVISHIITGWNKFMMKTVELIRTIAPAVIWFIEHFKLVSIIVVTVIVAMNSLRLVFVGLQLLISGFRLYEWFISANAGALLFRNTVASIGPAILTWLGPLAAVLTAIGAVVLGFMAIKKLNNEFDPIKIRDEQIKKNNEFRFERDIDKYINQKYPVQSVISAPGSKVELSPEQKNIMNQRAKALEMKDYLIWQYAEAQKRGVTLTFTPDMMDPFAMKGVKGMANSAMNVPMPVEAKKGKLDSIGRINDDINLNTDSLQMLKAIAERSWIMQNEVTVPQKVDVSVNNISELEPESIAQMINEGSKVAIASSMRGAYA